MPMLVLARDRRQLIHTHSFYFVIAAIEKESGLQLWHLPRTFFPFDSPLLSCRSNLIYPVATTYKVTPVQLEEYLGGGRSCGFWNIQSLSSDAHPTGPFFVTGNQFVRGAGQKSFRATLYFILCTLLRRMQKAGGRDMPSRFNVTSTSISTV
ncbi:hypothetical protein ACMFMF_004867 [Clarireedia jacksonii]